WLGGQAEYVLVPYADFNLLKFPDKAKRMAKIKDLTLLSDIFPTVYPGAYTAGVPTAYTLYVAGGGPVGLACAASCHPPGAAVSGEALSSRTDAGDFARQDSDRQSRERDGHLARRRSAGI